MAENRAWNIRGAIYHVMNRGHRCDAIFRDVNTRYTGANDGSKNEAQPGKYYVTRNPLVGSSYGFVKRSPSFPAEFVTMAWPKSSTIGNSHSAQ